VTGWRVGWAIAPPAITQRIRKVHDFLTVGAPTPFQHAAAVALAFPAAYYEELQAHYAAARDFFHDLLLRTGFKCRPPRGAYYILADASNLMAKIGAEDDFSFSRRLIELTGVATVPGSTFFANPAHGRNHVRFCFCKKWETLRAVAKAFEEKLR